MSIIKLPDELKKKIAVLAAVPAQSATEIISFAEQSILNPPTQQENQTFLVQNAKNLKIDKGVLEECIKAILFVLIESAKNDLSEQDFPLVAFDLKQTLPAEVYNSLEAAYTSNKEQLRRLIVLLNKRSAALSPDTTTNAPSTPTADAQGEAVESSTLETIEDVRGSSVIPRYKNIEWRLDILLDSRSLRQPATPKPSFIIKLETQQSSAGSTDTTYLNADYHDLNQMCDKLGQALKELNTNHVRRIRHYIK